jgi:hypothetical protein
MGVYSGKDIGGPYGRACTGCYDRTRCGVCPVPTLFPKDTSKVHVMQDAENKVDSDPIVAVMFECRQSLKRDFGAAALADGHETFSAGLRQIMQRYTRRWKSRERYGRQMQPQGMPGAGGNGISEETVMPEALGGGLQGEGQ